MNKDFWDLTTAGRLQVVWKIYSYLKDNKFSEVKLEDIYSENDKDKLLYTLISFKPNNSEKYPIRIEINDYYMKFYTSTAIPKKLPKSQLLEIINETNRLYPLYTTYTDNKNGEDRLVVRYILEDYLFTLSPKYFVDKAILLMDIANVIYTAIYNTVEQLEELGYI